MQITENVGAALTVLGRHFVSKCTSKALKHSAIADDSHICFAPFFFPFANRVLFAVLYLGEKKLLFHLDLNG
jgi:hypothetical protein